MKTSTKTNVSRRSSSNLLLLAMLLLLPLLLATAALAQSDAPTPTTSLAPWRTPGAHAVPGTSIRFPKAGDYWVANGTGVVSWAWDGAFHTPAATGHKIRLAHVNTSIDAAKWVLINTWNVLVPSDVLGKYSTAYTEIGKPFVNTDPIALLGISNKCVGF